MTWLLFDLNGTLLDPGDKKRELRQAATLAMAETMTGCFRPFSEFLPDPPEPKLFDDADEGLRRLIVKYRLAVLTNSATADAEAALEAVGVRELFEFVIGSDAVHVFKPHPRIYALGITRTGRPVNEVMMVAAHATDLLGARRAGMRVAYLSRHGDWPPMLEPPDFEAPDLRRLFV